MANPCGLVAKYHFSDKIVSLRETFSHDDPFLINETSIASKNQQSQFVRNEDVYETQGYWVDPTNEHIIVWF